MFTSFFEIEEEEKPTPTFEVASTISPLLQGNLVHQSEDRSTAHQANLTSFDFSILFFLAFLVRTLQTRVRSGLTLFPSIPLSFILANGGILNALATGVDTRSA
jgi:hypothetical protein